MTYVSTRSYLPPCSFKFKKMKVDFSDTVEYVLKRVSFGSKDCTKKLKIECAYFLGQTS